MTYSLCFPSSYQPFSAYLCLSHPNRLTYSIPAVFRPCTSVLRTSEIIPNWIVLTPRHLVTMYYHRNNSSCCITHNCQYFTLSRRRTMSRPEASMVSHSIRSRVPQALLNNSTCCLRSDSFSREDTSISWVTRTSSWNLSTCWVMELVSANTNRWFCEVYSVSPPPPPT